MVVPAPGVGVGEGVGQGAVSHHLQPVPRSPPRRWQKQWPVLKHCRGRRNWDKPFGRLFGRIRQGWPSARALLGVCR